METKTKIMYLIVSKRNQPDYYTLSLFKKDCISRFIEGSNMTWAQTKKFGWRCLKVDVTIQASSNEDF